MPTCETLLLTSSYPRFKGDYAGVFVSEYANLFKTVGTVLVIAPDDKAVHYNYTPFNIPIIRFSKRYTRKQGPFYAAGGPENLAEYKRLAEVPLAFSQMLLAAKKNTKDAKNIVAHWMVPAGLVGALVKKKHQKLQVVVHGGDWHLLKKIPFGKRLARFIIRKADSIIVVAKYQKREMLQLFSDRESRQLKKRIKHVTMGINTKEFANTGKIQAIKPVVLTVGRLVKIKGFDRLAKALENLDLELCLAGDGPEKHNLQKLYKKHNISARFLGDQPHDKVVELYNKVTMVVIPSRSLNGRVEGTPRVAIEAMAAKCPIVATATGGTAEILQHQVNSLLDYSDDKELKSNIEYILESKQLRETLANKAFENVKKFDWKNLQEQIIENLR